MFGLRGKEYPTYPYPPSRNFCVSVRIILTAYSPSPVAWPLRMRRRPAEPAGFRCSWRRKPDRLADGCFQNQRN
nr:hypothetical protein [Tick-associated circular DNA virus]